MDIDTLLNGGEACLKEMVANQVQESLTLDFKSGRLFKEGILDKPQKETLAAAVCAFANAIGGVLVIGVDCRKNAAGEDCAGDLVPIAEIGKALTTSTQAIADSLQSRHSGIRVESIPSIDKPGFGYLVIDIPASDLRPHRSQVDAKYYKRTGASNYVMEHYEVVDAIRSAASPELVLSYQLTKGISRPHENRIEVRLRVAARNVGRATARHVSLQITEIEPYEVGWHSLGENVFLSTFGNTRTLSHTPELVIHPGETRVICMLSLDVNDGDGTGATIGGVPDQRKPLRVHYRCNAEHYAGQTESLEISLNEIYSTAKRA